jgi:GNAT superfamily N-acetyltransferase
MKAPQMPELRPFKGPDIEPLYAISLATGDSGKDASAVYRDARMIGHIYSAPYALFSPETALVAEDEDGVGGYVVGALNTRAFEERLERDWWPALRERYPAPSGEPATWDADQRRSFMIHHPRRTPDLIVNAFPSHLHMNIAPRMQGRGVGSALLRLWLSSARLMGAKGVHLGTNGANHRAMRFWEARGFARLELPPIMPSDSTIWFGQVLEILD